MSLFRGKYRIESARLEGFDYTSPGSYFVTICTKDRIAWFGDIQKGEMHRSAIGEIVAEEWQKTPAIRPNVTLDEWRVMPNHFHGIVVIGETHVGVTTQPVETTRRVVSTNQPTLKPNSLGSIIGQFKSQCTKRIHATGNRDFAWQPRYHDHIIRDEDDLNRIREYIINNPANWDEDDQNPSR
ncbi:MAG: transposase [Bacteroidota bacterium]